MVRKRLGMTVLLGSMLLTFTTLFALPASVEGRPQALTPEQLRLVAEKERVRAAANISFVAEGPANAQPDAPTRPFTKKLQTTRAELLTNWQTR